MLAEQKARQQIAEEKEKLNKQPRQESASLMGMRGDPRALLVVRVGRPLTAKPSQAPGLDNPQPVAPADPPKAKTSVGSDGKGN